MKYRVTRVSLSLVLSLFIYFSFLSLFFFFISFHFFVLFLSLSLLTIFSLKMSKTIQSDAQGQKTEKVNIFFFSISKTIRMIQVRNEEKSFFCTFQNLLKSFNLENCTLILVSTQCNKTGIDRFHDSSKTILGYGLKTAKVC